MSQRYIGGLIYNPPGGFSGYFDGSGDYLTVADSATLEPGSSDFTFECWVFPTATGSYLGVFSKRATNGVYGPIQVLINNGTMEMAASTSGSSWAVVATASSSPALNTWSHIAVVRNGTASNNLVLYLNGVSVATGSVSSTALFDNSGAWAIGADAAAGTGAFAGYISNFRYVKGSAVYTSAFTPPNGPLQAITNTSLLTCAYGTFRDGSTNNFTITVNGNTAVSTQNPFPLTTLPNPALGGAGNGIYSMSQYQALRSQNLWPAIDPYWRNVTLLLHGNGTNGAQNNTFLDSSTNNFTITRNGNTTQGTFAPYGSNWSNYFDGSSSVRAPVAASTFGSSNFTIEGWVYHTTSGTFEIIYANYAGSTNGTQIGIDTSNNFFFNVFQASGTPSVSLSSAAGSVPSNTWTHFAVTRSSSTFTLYVNGVSAASGTFASSLNSPDGAYTYIGQRTFGASTNYLNGYVSNFRIVNGTAVYTAAFTPSTSPLTAITNTSLLTCQSNRFIDNSTNAFAITVSGSPSVQRFSPFNPTTPYAAGTDGGSGYFDGSGDYLTLPSNAAWAFGTGDFTIECWVNPSTQGGHGSSNNDCIIDFRPNAAGAYGTLYLNNSGAAVAWFVNNANRITGGAIPNNAWTHIVVSRVSGNTRLFLNGVQSGSTYADSTNYAQGTPWIAQFNDGTGGGYFNGYMTDMRVVKGSGVTSVTVPTAPLTAITNTQLLLSYTNAGIIDNAEMNNLETVGNAQISTAQSKFGGASMYFDGSGDYLTAVSTPNLNLSSGNFTIEAWIYWTGSNANSQIINKDGVVSASYPSWAIDLNGSGYLRGVVGTGNGTSSVQTFVASVLCPTNSWVHVAFVKNGTTITLYQNGTSVASATQTATMTDGGKPVYVGYQNGQPSSNYFDGYIDDLRITKAARYTTSFTPQRSQWQDQ